MRGPRAQGWSVPWVAKWVAMAGLTKGGQWGSKGGQWRCPRVPGWPARVAMSGVSKHGVPVGGASGASVGSKSGGSKGGKGGHAKHWLVAWRTKGPTGTSGDLIAAGGPRVPGGEACRFVHFVIRSSRNSAEGHAGCGVCRVLFSMEELCSGRWAWGALGTLVEQSLVIVEREG